jgi:hypothetical protein
MESVTHLDPPHMIPAVSALPEDRQQWPREADDACNQLRRELDRWSRDNDWPHSCNSWVAEEAVRRAW